MALVDRSGKLVRFTIRPGNFYEGHDVETLLEGIPTEELIADKAYDSNRIRLQLASAGIEAVIPPRTLRKVALWYDIDRYAERHFVENFFAKIKQFRRIATRYEKTAACFAGMINLAALYLETKTIRRREPGRQREKTPKIAPVVRPKTLLPAQLSYLNVQRE